MAWFGLTVEEVLRVWNMTGEDFNSPVNAGVNNYATIIGNALSRAESRVLANLPDRVVAMLDNIEYEYVTRDADSGQTTATLTHTTSDTSKVLLWQFEENEWVIGQLAKSSDYRITAFTVSGKTVTLTTGMAEGDVLIASYPVGLRDDCNSLHSPLLDLAAVELLVPRYPDMREDFERRAEMTLRWLELVRLGETMLPEIARLDLVDETGVERGGMIVTWRNPA